jgi:hypothetical protein
MKTEIWKQKFIWLAIIENYRTGPYRDFDERLGNVVVNTRDVMYVLTDMGDEVVHGRSIKRNDNNITRIEFRFCGALFYFFLINGDSKVLHDMTMEQDNPEVPIDYERLETIFAELVMRYG